jgi:hypothetical protein
MLAGVGLLTVNDFPDVDAIVEQTIEGSPRVHAAPGGVSGAAGADFAVNPMLLKIISEFLDTAQSHVLPKNLADGIRVGTIYDEATLNPVVTQGDDASHPHALFL